MHKTIILASLFLVIVLGCKKEEPDFSYDVIVDSSFYCEATVDGEYVSFPFHDRPTFGTEIYGDSILIKAFLNYRESEEPYVNIFQISISKKFKISELTYSINNNGVPYNSGDISNEEFQSMFHSGDYPYSYNDCWSTECDKSEGVELSFDSFHGTTFKTEWLQKFAGKEDSEQFYKNADFKLTKLEWLSKDVVVLEGEFNTDIYSFNGNLIHIRNGYFKAYSNNIMNPEVVNKDILWNK